MIAIVVRLRWAAPALVLVLTGCATAALERTGDSYYDQGAEQALAELDEAEIRPQDRLLALMDQAVAKQELGRYEDSNRALAAALDLVQPLSDGAGSPVVEEAGVYRGEYFERVYLWTLRMANDLALQDMEAAASDADGALDTMSAVGCDRCRFPFTRYLAAVSLEGVGEVDRAIDVLAEAVVESPRLPFLDGELDRLLAADRGPPDGDGSAGTDRVLYVFLLLGKGPQKVPGVLPVPPGRVVPWPVYEPRQPPGVTAATLVVDRKDFEAVPLTDVDALARASLVERLQEELVDRVGTTDAEGALARVEAGNRSLNLGMMLRVLPAVSRCDLRHWSTLPATCQVLRVPVAPHVNVFQLLYTADDGTIVDRETLDLPASWVAGPLFITRRLP